MNNSNISGEDDEFDKLLPRREDRKPNLSVWRQRLLTAVLLSVHFSTLCTDTFLFPFFPLEAKKHNLTDIQIGLVFSSFEFARFVTSFISGYLVGRVNPKIMCIIGGALTTLCCISFGLITYAPERIYFPLCILVRILAGSGTATLTVSVMSILLKTSCFEAATIVGVVEMVEGAGYAAGPALGAALFKLCGYACVFWIVGSLMAVLNIIQIFVVPDFAVEVKSQHSVLNMLKIPGIIVLFFQTIVLKFGGSIYNSGKGEFLAFTFHQSPDIIGMLFAVGAIIFLLACPLTSKLVNKGYVYSPVIICWVLYIAASMFAGPSPLLDFIFHGKRYFILFAIMNFIMAAVRVPIYIGPFKAAIDLAGVNGYQTDSIETCGMIAGTLNSGYAFGAMFGPTVGGAITQTLDFTWTMTVLAGIQTVMLAILIVYLVVMKITKQPLREEDIKNLGTDQTGSNKLIADKLDQCFTESMKKGTTSAAVQPQKQ